MSISGDTILGDEESSEGSVVSRGTRTHVLHGMGNSDIYRTINKMATKLSHIENEIKCKTLKLNKINRQNLDEVNGIRSRLEYHISQKDKQIRILTAQLDEMHTALALSHERELRSVNKGPGYGDFSVHYDVDSRKGTNSEMDASMRLYRNQTCISKNSIPLRSNLAFDRRSHTMDKGLGGLKTTNVSTRNTMEARAHGDKIVSGMHNEYYTGFSPELEPSPVPYDIANSNRIMNKTHSNKEPKGIPSNLAHPSKHIVPLAWVKGSISNGGKASLESGANMVRNNRSLQPDSKLTHTLRTPGTTVLPLGTAPTLVHRHCLPVTKNEDMDKTASQLNNLGQSVKPPAIKTLGLFALLYIINILETQNASKAVSSMVTANEDDTNAKIAILERDLITTKVALADSETQRDIEIAKILKSKAST
uniref:Uncharacterized protein n=2 Tax=Babesia bovis TaxID=5865 RepID=A7AW52_BABBO|eukprot:XP_001608848.1 hypothetical protein [Babesia bovis T2Bo]